MRTVFRVNASSEIGSRHVMRLLSLAEAMPSGGGNAVSIVSRTHSGHLAVLIKNRAYPARLPSIKTIDDQTVTYASWLGASLRRDAEQTRALLDEAKLIDWLVINVSLLESRRSGSC